MLEVDGELALYVNLACKSFMTPLLPHSWSSHCIPVAALQVMIIADLISRAAPSFFRVPVPLSQARISGCIFCSGAYGVRQKKLFRIGWTVDCMSCPVDCIGCSCCVVHQGYLGCLC